MSALEVVSFLGKLLCAVAALKAALYLLRRLCLAMAWKSGGSSHSELIHNLRSESGAGGAGGAPLASAAQGPLPAARTSHSRGARPAANCQGAVPAGGGGEGGAQPGGVCLGVRSGPSREGAANAAAVPQPGGGRRPLAQGGPGLLLREEMRREGRCRWRSRKENAVWRPWLFSARRLPPFSGPVPAALSPPARNPLVRTEAGPRRQLRRARDPPHAPGSVSLWLRTCSRRRVSAPLGGGERCPRPLVGRAVVSAGAQRPSFGPSGPGFPQWGGPGCFCLVKGACGSRPLVRSEMLASRPSPELLLLKRWVGPLGQERSYAEVTDSHSLLAFPCLPGTWRSLSLAEVCAVPVLYVEGVRRVPFTDIHQHKSAGSFTCDPG